MEAIAALIALTAMEIVLGIDNVVFIAIVASKLPAEKQLRARLFGLAIALLFGFDQTFRHDSGCAFVGQKHHPFAGRSIPHREKHTRNPKQVGRNCQGARN